VVDDTVSVNIDALTGTDVFAARPVPGSEVKNWRFTKNLRFKFLRAPLPSPNTSSSTRPATLPEIFARSLTPAHGLAPIPQTPQKRLFFATL